MIDLNEIKIALLGAGTFGMALTRVLALSGRDVSLWSHSKDKLSTYDKTRFFPPLNMQIPTSVSFDSDIVSICKDKKLVIIAVPSVNVRETIRKALPGIAEGTIIVSVAKGIEADTLMSMTDIIEDEAAKAAKKLTTVALSGPTHAEEVAVDMPSMIVSASKKAEAALLVQDVFYSTNLRVYTNSDVKGVELCGAMKNIIAIASGLITGLSYGDNTRAALITRGLAEITRLGEALGCDKSTFYGLSGIGDLIVTCTSTHSRNFRAGLLLAKGLRAPDIKKEIGQVIEGFNALKGAIKLSEKTGVELPIAQSLKNIIEDNADPLNEMQKLMSRAKKDERR